MTDTILLASTSPIRRQLLDQAGVRYEAVAPAVDEAALKRDFPGNARDLALSLAAAKAVSVPADRWVIGADSVLEVEGKLYSKPVSREDAAAHLRAFSGRTMRLSSAVTLARAGNVEWHHVETAHLHVRTIGEAFIADYLDREWPEVGYCVGVFRMEALGVTLFERVEGDHFTILGLPLLPLLGALRSRGLAA